MKNKLKYKNILWDWNGTLMDDVGVALNAVNVMLSRRGRDSITLRQYREYIGVPIIRFYEKCFDIEREDKEALFAEYQREYAVLAASLPKDSVTHDTVLALHELGVRQFVVSSCEEGLLCDWLKRYRIANLLEGVTGAGNIYAESKIDRAVRLMRDYELSADETVFVGDLLHDYDTARALGVDCILVTYGHQLPEECKKTGCVIADGLSEIPYLLCEDSAL